MGKRSISALREIDGIRLPTIRTRPRGEEKPAAPADPEQGVDPNMDRIREIAGKLTFTAPASIDEMRKTARDQRIGLYARALEVGGNTTEAAACLGIARGQFHRDFKAYTGKTPRQYLQYLGGK